MRWFIVAVLALTGCGVDTQGVSSGGTLCDPGRVIECACPGGDKGSQACNDTGTGYDACECPNGISKGVGGATSSQSSSSVGGSGAGGMACVPKTCSDQGKNCGSIDDGCGHSMDCCPSGGDCCPAYYVCGGDNIIMDQMNQTVGDAIPGVPNVCGGGCAYIETFRQDSYTCKSQNALRPYAWYCATSIENEVAPYPGCLSSNPPDSFHIWCCDHQ